MYAASETPRFFERLDRFGTNPALIDAQTGEAIDYATLADRVAARAATFSGPRGLVFLEARNTIGSIIDYLAALAAGHVVHLLDTLSGPRADELIALYTPALIVDAEGNLRRTGAPPLAIHPDLCVLLSTSGSTGSPKFVKLSVANLDANAKAIAAYLELDASERALQHLKPHYSYGLSVINSHLGVGAALVLTAFGVNEPAFWQAFDTYGATSFAGVPYTFETLDHLDFDPAAHPSLRYATQAGGKLEAGLVRRFASAFVAAGKRFVVMYGQTEAAPRMSYLPPELAAEHPDSIGRAIPGGELFLVDAEGQRIAAPDIQGELAYRGPNVMMGYASAPGELAGDETPSHLLTGDLAMRRENGLFVITGRTARFVKPFGVRVNLDEVQSFVKARHARAAVAGTDTRIVVGLEGAPGMSVITPAELARRFGLADHLFEIRHHAQLPVLPNGKLDYQRLLDEPQASSVKPSLLNALLAGVIDILGLKPSCHDSVESVFRAVLGDMPLDMSLSFRDMTFDSLSFVALAVELEDLFGDHLPENWQDLPLSALESRYEAVTAAALG